MTGKFIWLCLGCVAMAAAAEARRPVFVNYDMTHFAFSRAEAGVDVDEGHVRELVRQYDGTEVTDMLFDMGGRIASVTNSAMESWVDKYDQKVENGKPVDYTGIAWLKLYRDLEVVKGIDRFALWFEEARKFGIHPWMSFRMNDIHESALETSPLSPEYFHRHHELWRVRHRDHALGYFDRCYDYGLEAVRKQRLDYIAELLGRYDVDGVEVDWMREIYCFAPGREDAGTIDGVMREIRRLADAAAKRYGHPVRISARVPADPETALRYGFDAVRWADERLIDVLTPAPRFETLDTDIPVDLWKRLLRGREVQVIPGLEIMMNASIRRFYALTDQVVGAAAAMYSAGADGIYLFNYFDDPCLKTTGKGYWERNFDQPGETMAVAWANQRQWLAFLGEPDRVLAAPRAHVLTFRDVVPLYGEERHPFQSFVGKDQPRYFRLATGKVGEGRKLTLRIGAWGGVAPARVFVNSRPCRFLREEKCVPAFTESPLYCYEVPELPEAAALVEIIPDRLTELTYLDLLVGPDAEGVRRTPPPRPEIR